MRGRGEERNLPIRISYWEDEEVEHIQERAVLRVRNEAVHHEGHRGRADPLSSVNTWTSFSLHSQKYLTRLLIINNIPPSINMAGFDSLLFLFLFLKYNNFQ